MSHVAPARPLSLFAAKLRKLYGMGEADSDLIAALPCAERSVQAGSYLIRQGERHSTVLVLLGGYVQRHKIVRSGGRQIVSVHLPGDLLNFPRLPPAKAKENIQALTASKVAEIPLSAMVGVLKRAPSALEALTLDQIADGAIMQEWIVNLGRRDALTRTAHLLCELGLRQATKGLGDRARFPMPFTQEQLGDILGLTSVHINRTLRSMASQGLIEYGDGWVSIPDLRRLEQAGDFDGGYLQVEPAISGSPDTDRSGCRSAAERIASSSNIENEAPLHSQLETR